MEFDTYSPYVYDGSTDLDDEDFMEILNESHQFDENYNEEREQFFQF